MQRFSFSQLTSARRKAVVAVAVVALVSGGSAGIASAHTLIAPHHKPSISRQASNDKSAKKKGDGSQSAVTQDIIAINKAYKSGDQATMDAAVQQLQTDLDTALANKAAKGGTTTTTAAGDNTTTTVATDDTTTTVPDDTTTTAPDDTTTTVVNDDTTTTMATDDTSTTVASDEPGDDDVTSITSDVGDN